MIRVHMAGSLLAVLFLPLSYILYCTLGSLNDVFETRQDTLLASVY